MGPLRRLIQLLRGRRDDRQMRRDQYRSIAENTMYSRMENWEVTRKEYDQFCQAIDDDEICDELIAKCEESPEGFEGAFSWGNVRQWIADNWLSILRLAITILFMFAEQRRNAEAKNNRRQDNT